jgi:toxin ParE1/3/4
LISHNGKYRFSPLAEAQLEDLWDYGYRRFGEHQADSYLDDLFAAISEVAATGHYLGLRPALVPPDRISDITSFPIHYMRYGREFVYLRELQDGAIGIICILGDRMDTPNRLKEHLSSLQAELS